MSKASVYGVVVPDLDSRRVVVIDEREVCVGSNSVFSILVVSTVMASVFAMVTWFGEFQLLQQKFVVLKPSALLYYHIGKLAVWLL